MTQVRERAGIPAGGRFATARRTAPDVATIDIGPTVAPATAGTTGERTSRLMSVAKFDADNFDAVRAALPNIDEAHLRRTWTDVNRSLETVEAWEGEEPYGNRPESEHLVSLGDFYEGSSGDGEVDIDIAGFEQANAEAWCYDAYSTMHHLVSLDQLAQRHYDESGVDWSPGDVPGYDWLRGPR